VVETFLIDLGFFGITFNAGQISGAGVITFFNVLAVVTKYWESRKAAKSVNN
jgi:hypothetical protein